MDISTVQAIKAAIVSTTGLPRDALHIYVGLTTLILVAIIWRKSLGSIAPWLVVLFIALVGELIDMGDDLLSFGYWRWAASVKDMFNTLFWPTVLLLYTRFCGSSRRP